MYSATVGIIGETNAGKSTLLNRICDGKLSAVNAKRHTTRRRVVGLLESEDRELVFVDTPGFTNESSALSRLMTQQTQSVGDVDFLVLVVDTEKTLSKPNYPKLVLRHIEERLSRLPDIVLLNKLDLIETPKVLEAISLFNEQLGADAEYFPVSAKSGTGVAEVCQFLLKNAPEHAKRVVTKQSENFLVAELIREKLIKYLNAELPHELSVRVDQIEDTEYSKVITATIYVAAKSQKPIVIGKGGQLLKTVGTAVRKELEQSSKQKVNISLFVKVQKDWHTTYRGLEEAGVICQ